MGLDDPGPALAAAADEAVTLGLPGRSVTALANLSLVLGGEPEVAQAFAGTLPAPAGIAGQPTVATPFAPTATLTPSPSPTASATATATSTLQSTTSGGGPTRTPTPGVNDFALVDQTAFCNTDLMPGLMIVFVQDADGEGIPGVEIVVQWSGGQDNFFTGLKPEQGPGYADFVMTEGRVYTVRLVDGSTPISERSGELQAAQCTPDADSEPQLEGYRLVFRRG